MGDRLLWQIVLQVVLIALNAVFACAEIALLSTNEAKLEKMAEEGNKKAARLVRLTSQPARFLATIQVAITLSGFLGSAFAAENFSDRLVNWLISIGLKFPVTTVNTICVIIITIILSYFTLVFGELVPKRVAMKNAEKVALGMSGVILFISKLFAPIVWLLTISTNGILRLLGIDPNAEDEEVTEEEILIMVDAGSEKGAIDVGEREMIQNVFEFNDLTAGEIATHRTEISLLWLDESVEQWDTTIRESRHSRYPVCDESVDNVIGVLNAKDYYRLMDKSKESILDSAVKPAYFIPESVRADVLLRNMKMNKNHFAVVLDEYGGMYGVVTMNDLMEQLVGELEEEDDAKDEFDEVIERIDSKTWKVHGSTPLEDVEEKLGVKLPTEEYDTFGGLVFGALGTIPDDGKGFELDTAGLHIRVIDIKKHRVDKALVCVDEKCASETESETLEKAE